MFCCNSTIVTIPTFQSRDVTSLLLGTSVPPFWMQCLNTSWLGEAELSLMSQIRAVLSPDLKHRHTVTLCHIHYSSRFVNLSDWHFDLPHLPTLMAMLWIFMTGIKNWGEIIWLVSLLCPNLSCVMLCLFCEVDCSHAVQNDTLIKSSDTVCATKNCMHFIKNKVSYFVCFLRLQAFYSRLPSIWHSW